MLRDSDDLDPRAIVAGPPSLDAHSDNGLALPESPGHFLIDDRDSGSRGGVGLLEGPPLDHRDAERPKIIGRDDEPPDPGLLAQRRIRPSLHRDERPGVVSAHRKSADGGRGVNARHPGETVEQGFEEGPRALFLGILALGQIDLKRHDSRGTKARIDPSQQ